MELLGQVRFVRQIHILRDPQGAFQDSPRLSIISGRDQIFSKT